MTVEVATYITDFQPLNPPSSDPRSQGDDHIRLVKQVLQNTFPNANRAVFAASTSAKSTNYSIVKADGEATFYVSTAAGAVTLTLPSLAAGDAGWRVYFVKTSTDVNPMFIAPASGNLTSGYISGLSKARRCIPGPRNLAIWDGANWFVSRSNALPVGCMIDIWSSSLPPGYEWPNGQTLASVATNYPEYNAAYGTGGTPDLRGCVATTLDNLGGAAAGRLGGGVINGSVLGSIAGSDVIALSVANLAVHSHANALSGSTAHQHGFSYNGCANVSTTGGGGFATGYLQGASGTTDNGNLSLGIANANAGSGTAHSNLQPSVMCGKILIVE